MSSATPVIVVTSGSATPVRESSDPSAIAVTEVSGGNATQVIITTAPSATPVQFGDAPAAVTWNPLDKDVGITLLDGNLRATGSAGQTYRTLRATTPITAGQKKTWEITYSVVGAVDASAVGFANLLESLSNWLGNSSVAPYSVGIFDHDTHVYSPGNSDTMSTTWDVNVTVTFCLDFDSKLLWAGIGPGTVWNAGGTANPATGVGGFAYSATGDLYPAATLNGLASALVNFSADGRSRAVPSSYSVIS